MATEMPPLRRSICTTIPHPPARAVTLLGHALVVPRRHVATWFEATEAERLALLAGIDRTRAAVARWRPADVHD